MHCCTFARSISEACLEDVFGGGNNVILMRIAGENGMRETGVGWTHEDSRSGRVVVIEESKEKFEDVWMREHARFSKRRRSDYR